MYSEPSEFYCTSCGKKGIPIIRKSGSMRKGGHLKKLYCLNCKIQTNHVEVKPFTEYDFDKFKIEYEYGNFDDEGNRLLTMGELKEAIRNGREKVKSLDTSGTSRQW